MTETRTKIVNIDLSDDPEDEVRLARMEVELLPWKWAVQDEGFKVINFTMQIKHSYFEFPNPKPLSMDFEVTMHIVPKEK